MKDILGMRMAFDGRQLLRENKIAIDRPQLAKRKVFRFCTTNLVGWGVYPVFLLSNTINYIRF